jgi:phage host-nuclease inhibitor protein Gam
MAKKTLEEIATHSKAAWGVGKFMAQLANNAFAQMRIENDYAKKISALQKEKNQKLAEKQGKQEEIVQKMIEMLSKYDNLFVKGLKSIAYATGRVGFRKMKPSVEIADGFTEQALLAKLSRWKKRYLRLKPELNRQAILQDFQDGKFRKIAGIEIKQGEEFFVTFAARGDEKPPKPVTVPLPKK